MHIQSKTELCYKRRIQRFLSGYKIGLLSSDQQLWLQEMESNNIYVLKLIWIE